MTASDTTSYDLADEYKDKSDDELRRLIGQYWHACYDEIKQTWEDYGYIMADVDFRLFHALQHIEDDIVRPLSFEPRGTYVCAFYFIFWVLWENVDLERDKLLSVLRKINILLGDNEHYFEMLQQAFSVALGDTEWSDDSLCAEKYAEMSNWIADTYGYNYTKEDWR